MYFRRRSGGIGVSIGTVPRLCRLRICSDIFASISFSGWSLKTKIRSKRERIVTGKPKSLRDKLQVVLREIIDMEKETGMVEKRALLEKLEKDYDIRQVEAERLIGQLIRDGTIYEPREGFIKKT